MGCSRRGRAQRAATVSSRMVMTISENAWARIELAGDPRQVWATLHFGNKEPVGTLVPYAPIT
jgi:hypothetical protein